MFDDGDRDRDIPGCTALWRHRDTNPEARLASGGLVLVTDDGIVMNARDGRRY
jgi:hypothetical protein